MAMPTVDIADPDDWGAKDQYATYWRYRKDTKGMTKPQRRLYALRHEPDTWLAAWFTLSLLCMTCSDANPWLLAAAGAAAGVGGGVYWSWVWERTPSVVRKYERLLQAQRILRVPKFLYDAVAKRAAESGIVDWDEFETQRFRLLADTLLEAEPWLSQLRDDCGCEGECGHTNRLKGRVRRKLRARVRGIGLHKLELASAAHNVALELNSDRNQQIRDQLRLTDEEDS